MIELRNNRLKVKIATLGAEIKSLYAFETSREYIWEGNRVHWPRSSPVLFPIVGALRNNEFLFDGKKYTIQKHGFARDMLFDIIEVSSTSVSFRLSSESLTIDYPFDFELIIKYKLLENTLICKYAVVNKSIGSMFFSIGAHPAFKLDFTEAQNWTDYFIKFELDGHLQRQYLVDNLLADKTQVIELNGHQLPLTHNMFDEDAWVLRSLKSSKITLSNQQGNYSLEVTHGDFSYFGLWSVPGSSFLCLEPWWGLNDSLFSSDNIEEKEGVIELAKDKIWHKEWCIKINS
ncbi:MULTISPECIES: aldose 1-epimerase family protein [Sphingobacterium]|uniref:aldose 1-epimerase family protein n=1 Tax=Sphingobacterium TaxID=28453 RepID=UPI0013DC0891|nr:MULTISPECIES: aldose 1-epimerase family protein [unclassified Sphingobacterium]